jgi:uncharacterized repeat protein (TIGR01451 family)
MPGGDVDFRDVRADTDGDGVSDDVDIDDDNDGIRDAYEGPGCYFSATELAGTLTATATDLTWLAANGIALSTDDATNTTARPSTTGQAITDKTIIEFSLARPAFVQSLTAVMAGAKMSSSTTSGQIKLQGWNGTAWIDLTASAYRTVATGNEVFTNTLASSTKVSKLRLFGTSGLLGQPIINTVTVSLSPFEQSSYPKANQCATDTDGDGVSDIVDLDSDNDTIPDNIENQSRTAYIAPGTFTDANHDGLNDVYATLGSPVDSAADMTPDFQSVDSDRDGIDDIVEAGNAALDANADGLSDNAVGTNGLDNTLDNGDTYVDVNGTYSAATQLPDTQYPGGQSDYADSRIDSDGDGVLDKVDADADNDGLANSQEGQTCLKPNGDFIGATYFESVDITGFRIITVDPREEWIDGNFTTGYPPFNWTNQSVPITFTFNLVSPIMADGLTLANDYGALGDGIKAATVYLYGENGVLLGVESYPKLLNTDTSAIDHYDFSHRYYDISSFTFVLPYSGPGTGGAAPNFQIREVGLWTGEAQCISLDRDSDGLPDYLDVDSDNDGIYDLIEAGVAATADADRNGRLDVMNTPAANDTDSDGWANAYDSTNGGTALVPVDFDADSHPDFLDLDSDNDGIPDNIEGQTSAAWVAPTGTDTDHDGLDDAYETMGGVTPVNTDGDANADFHDRDSDGDGKVDTVEAGFELADANFDGRLDATVDTDGDGLLNVVDITAWDPTNGLAGPLALPDEDVLYDGDGEPDFRDLDVDVPRTEIRLTKKAALADTNGDGKQSAGDVVTYTFTLTNTGTSTVTNASIVDAMVGAPITGVVCDKTTNPALASMARAAVVTCTATHALTQAEVNSGSVTNTATATATDPNGAAVAIKSDDPTNTTNVDSNGDGAPDDATVLQLTRKPQLTLLKSSALADTNGDGGPSAGDLVTYTFELTNTGNVTISGVKITDAALGGVICDSTSKPELAAMDPGAAVVCTATYTLVQADINRGKITNSAVATGTDSSNTSLTTTSDDPNNTANVDTDGDGLPDDETVTKLIGQPQLSLTKVGTYTDTDGSGTVSVGDKVSYSFAIANTGKVTMSDVSINDPLLGGLVCDGTTVAALGSMAPGDSATCAKDYAIKQADIDAGGVTNSATAAGTDPIGDTITTTSDDPLNAANTDTDGDGLPDDKTKTTLVGTPSMSMTKAGRYVDTDSSGTVNLGDTIEYTFLIANTGTVTLTDLEIRDDLLGGLVCDKTTHSSLATLAPGASTGCIASLTLTQELLDAGSVSNSATATGSTATGGQVSDTSDDPNNNTDTDTDGNGDPDDSTVTTLATTPAMTLTKLADWADANNNGLLNDGESVTYTFVVANVGEQTLHDLRVTDAMLGGVICDAATEPALSSLIPGATAQCTVTYTVTQADVDAGSIVNTASASGLSPSNAGVSAASDDPMNLTDEDSDGDGYPDDATKVPFTGAPAMSMTKAAVYVDADTNGSVNVGDILRYTFTVTNEGNTSLYGVSINDSALSSTPVCTSTTTPAFVKVVPESSASCTFDFVLTQAVIDKGSVTNTATANATAPGGAALTATSDDPADLSNEDTDGDGFPDDSTVTTFDVAPQLTITKTNNWNDANSNELLDANETITYNFVVTNVGQQTVTDVKVVDALIGTDPICDATTDPGLASMLPGAVVTCSATYTVLQSDVDAGVVENQATASGTAPDGSATTALSDDPRNGANVDTDGDGYPDDATTTPFRVKPLLHLDKTGRYLDLNADSVVNVGDAVDYTFTVSNRGNVTMTDVLVTDSLLGGTVCDGTSNAALLSLAPNATVVCTGRYVLTQDDLNTGSITNSAQATGVDPDGSSVTTDSDDPSNPANVDGSDEDTFPDDSTVTGLTVKSAMTVTKTGVANDVDHDGLIEAGESITYTFTVTNVGQQTITDVSVNDDLLGPDPVCDSTSVPALASMSPTATATCEATYVITQDDVDNGSVTNTATGSGSDPAGNAVTAASDDPLNSTDSDSDGDGYPDDATETTFGNNSELTLTKTVTSAPATKVGDTVTYEFTVTNTGSTTLSNVSVNDTLLGGVVCDSTTDPDLASLAPNAVVTCTGEYVVTQSDVNAGGVQNSAEGRATSIDGTITDTSDAGDEAVDTADLSGATDGDPTTDPTVSSIARTSAVSVKKTGPTGAFGIGLPLTYSIAVSNTGNVTATALTVTDDRTTDVVCPGSAWATPNVIDSLDPQTTITCEAVYVLTAADVAAGSFVNNANVSGSTLAGPVEGSGSVSTDIPKPSFTLDKKADLSALSNPVLVGDSISYTFTITNTSTLPITNVVVTDALLGGVVCTDTATAARLAELAPAEVVTCTEEYSVTQADIDRGAIVNHATVDGESPVGPLPQGKVDGDGDPTTDTDGDGNPSVDGVVASLTQTSGLTVTKSVVEQPDPTIAGSTLKYQIVVKNTGNTTLTVTSVGDPLVTNSPAPADDIFCTDPLPYKVAGFGTLSCLATYTVTQADVDRGSVGNTATVNVTDHTGAVVTKEGSTTATIAAEGGLTVAKSLSATAPAPKVPGDLMVFDIAVTNSGQLTLHDVVVHDALAAATVSCPSSGTSTIATLNVGATQTCTAVYAITQADIDHGGVENSADAAGLTPDGSVVTGPVSKTTGAVEQTASLLAEKHLADGSPVAGSTLTYEIDVTNTGTVTLSNVTVRDSLAPAAVVDCGDGTNVIAKLLPSAPKVTCTATYVVTQADVEAGKVSNIATVEAESPTGVVTDTSEPSIVQVPAMPGVSVAKDFESGDLVAGKNVVYTVVVHNTGNVIVNDIVVTDSLTTDVDCPATSLLPGATMTCRATYAVTQTNLDAGEIVNTATVAATTVAGPITNTNTNTKTVDQVSNLTVTKLSPTMTGPVALGAEMVYEIVVANSGNVTMDGIAVTDKGVPVACPNTSLAPGRTMSCFFTHVITQADLDAAKYVNEVQVTGTDPNGVVTTDSDTAEEELGATPAISIQKLPPAGGALRAGDVVTYRFVVANAGQQTITDFEITDPMVTKPVCPATELLPAESVTCTADHKVTQAEVDAGVITNTASVAGVAGAGGAPVIDTSKTVRTPISEVASMSVDKSMTPAATYAAGQKVTYTFAVTNTGNVTLGGIELSDPLVTNLTCPAASLATGASMTCTGERTLTQADVDRGYVSNVATATATGAQGGPATMTAEETATTAGIGKLTVTVAPPVDKDGTPVGDRNNLTAGEEITYPVTVTNSGALTIDQIELISSLGGTISCPSTTLAPSVSMVCTVKVVVTQAMIDAATVSLTATANGQDAYDQPVDDDGAATQGIAQTSSMTLVKSPPTGLAYPGRTLTYTITVTNTGNVTVTAPAVTDALTTDLTCESIATLAPGEDMTCTARYLVPDGATGSIVNSASVEGTGPGGVAVDATGSVSTAVLHEPSVTVVKGAPSGVVAEGRTITYPILVTNSGDVEVTISSVVDSITTSVSCSAPLGALAPGASISCVATYVVQAADVAAGSIVNRATVDYINPYSGAKQTATDTNTSAVSKVTAVTVDKSQPVGTVEVGSELTYTYTVTNTGTTVLDHVGVTDPSVDHVTCPAVASLAPGESMTCTATLKLTVEHFTAGSFGGKATVSADSVVGKVAGTDSESTTAEAKPHLAVVPHPPSSQPLTEGETLSFEVDVINDGNLPIGEVALRYPGASSIVCPQTDLAVGQKMTCTVVYKVTAEDVAAGKIDKAAVASGSVAGLQVENSGNTSIPTAPPIWLAMTGVETWKALWLALLTIWLGGGLVVGRRRRQRREQV